MGRLLDNIKQYLATHTKEEFRQAWEEVEKLGLKGPTVWEVVRMQQQPSVYRTVNAGVRFIPQPDLEQPVSDQPTLNLAA
jgi:hypothetical protein